jgi:hypothetical protein
MHFANPLITTSRGPRVGHSVATTRGPVGRNIKNRCAQIAQHASQHKQLAPRRAFTSCSPPVHLFYAFPLPCAWQRSGMKRARQAPKTPGPGGRRAAGSASGGGSGAVLLRLPSGGKQPGSANWTAAELTGEFGCRQ